MAIISISEAARRYRMGRQTIRKRIKIGELSASVTDGGAPGLDVSELIRVFGPIPGEPGTDRQDEPARTTTPNHAPDQASHAVLARLESENVALRAKVEAQAENLNDLRQAMRLLENKSSTGRRWWPF